MRIECTITDEEWAKIQPYVECREMANPMQDEFIFYDPTPEFLVMLTLFDIDYYGGK